MEIDIKVETKRTFTFTLSEADARKMEAEFGPGSMHSPATHGYCVEARSCVACAMVRAIRKELWLKI